MEGPRPFKSHGVVEAMQRGSPAWRAKLHRRAFARVEASRAALLARARGGEVRAGLREILESEARMMMDEGEEEEEEEPGGALDAGEEWAAEEWLMAMEERLKRDEEAEQAEEYLRFDEEALCELLSGLVVEPMDTDE